MRYVGWYPRRRGILEHLERGTISLLDSAIHDFLCLIADHATGIAFVSAEKIHALCPLDISYKSIQRSLAKLERLGWIKRWLIRGRRGNYPVLLCRYFVRDASGTWWSTSGEQTTDWKDVKFAPVHDESFNGSRSVREVAHEVAHELSGIQEGRSDTQETRSKNDSLSFEASSLNYEESSGENRLQPVGEKLEKAFESWDLPPSGVLKIGPDLCTSLYIDVDRLGADGCNKFMRNANRSWNSAWPDIAAGQVPLGDWIQKAVERATRSRIPYPAVLKLRMHQLERGELRAVGNRQ